MNVLARLSGLRFARFLTLLCALAFAGTALAACCCDDPPPCGSGGGGEGGGGCDPLPSNQYGSACPGYQPMIDNCAALGGDLQPWCSNNSDPQPPEPANDCTAITMDPAPGMTFPPNVEGYCCPCNATDGGDASSSSGGPNLARVNAGLGGNFSGPTVITMIVRGVAVSCEWSARNLVSCPYVSEPPVSAEEAAK